MRLLFSFLIFTFSFAATAQIPSYVPTNGLVGWWPFNGNANDESGNGNNGVVNGATLTTDRFGNVGKAYSFNGANNRIDLPLNLNGALLNLTQFSFSGFIKNVGASQGGIFSNWKDYPLTDPFGIAISTNSDRTLGAGNNSGASVYANNLNLSNWTHFVSVFDGNNGNALQRMRLFINGVQVLCDSTTQLAYSTICISNNLGNTANHTAFGAWFSQFGWIGYWSGTLDDVAIYNRALNSQEITQLYTSTFTPSIPEDTTSNVGIGTITPKRKLHVNDVMRLEPRNTAPANPAKGDIYFDGVLNKLRVYDGSVWQSCW